MKRIIWSCVGLVFGVLFVAGAIYALTSDRVECGGETMREGDICVSKTRGGRVTESTVEETKSSATVGAIASILIGSLIIVISAQNLRIGIRNRKALATTGLPHGVPSIPWPDVPQEPQHQQPYPPQQQQPQQPYPQQQQPPQQQYEHPAPLQPHPPHMPQQQPPQPAWPQQQPPQPVWPQQQPQQPVWPQQQPQQPAWHQQNQPPGPYQRR